MMPIHDEPDTVSIVFALVPDPYPSDLAPLMTLLSASELSHAEQFRFTQDRWLYVSAHALLRRCLENATRQFNCEFVTNPYGKPELILSPDVPALRFNLSHTPGLVVCALTHGHDVGVDAERVNVAMDIERLAARYFTPEERHQLAAANPVARIRLFFEVWTLKEAVIKADGRGLSMPLESFSVVKEPLSVSFQDPSKERKADWQLAQLLLPEHCLAVALRRSRGCSWPLRLYWHQVQLATLLPGANPIECKKESSVVTDLEAFGV